MCGCAGVGNVGNGNLYIMRRWWEQYKIFTIDPFLISPHHATDLVWFAVTGDSLGPSQEPIDGCAPLAEWFVLGPCVVSLEESPSSSPSRPVKLCISFVGVK